MTPKTSLKLVASTVIALGLSSAAFAGNGKDCNKKYKSTMTKTEAAQSTAVLPASAETMEHKAKKQMKVYTFDEALAKCQEYGAKDLQACIDKKTGKTAKPDS